MQMSNDVNLKIDFSRKHNQLSAPGKFTFALLCLLILFLVSAFTGRYHSEYSIFNLVLFNNTAVAEKEKLFRIFLSIRLPRICAAMLVGGALSLSGVVYQGIFKNPMVSPAILGASSGSAFGAAVAILLGGVSAVVQCSSFIMGVIAVSLSLLVSSIISERTSSMVYLVLSGVLVSTVFNSLISLIKYVADPFNTLPDITFWLLGSLSNVTAPKVFSLFLIILLACIPLFFLRWHINVLSLDTDEAKTMGINVRLLKTIVIFSSTLMTSAAVSVCGLVGWVGLVIPHIVRILFGPDFRIILGYSFVFGAGFMLIVDTVARSAGSHEIPLGILTALVGAPVFVLLIRKVKRGWL